jgi:hypothetical protein
MLSTCRVGGAGSVAAPGELRRLNLTEVQFESVAELLQDELCPIVLTASFKAVRWPMLKRWSKWAHLKRASPPSLAFEGLGDRAGGRYTYWDSSRVLAKAVGTPDHDKVRATGAAFLEAVNASEAGGSRWGRVRFGGRLATYEPLLRELRGSESSGVGHLAPLAPPGVALREPLIFVSASGVTCAAHFDMFSNTHLVLIGRKRIRLAPPSAAFVLDTRPGTHPSARQARRSIFVGDGSSDASSDEVLNRARGATSAAGPGPWSQGPPSWVEVLEAELRVGEALYIPPGWLHEVRTEQPSVAVSLTSDSDEYVDFNRWATEERETMLPFIHTSPPFTAHRLAAALTVFVPTLLAELDLAQEDAAGDYLHSTFLRAYGDVTRREANLPRLFDGWPRCEAPGEADAAQARSAAAAVAARFRRRYRREQLDLYLVLYLENILTMAVPKHVGDGVKATLGAMVAYVEACLAGQQADSQQQKDEL